MGRISVSGTRNSFFTKREKTEPDQVSLFLRIFLSQIDIYLVAVFPGTPGVSYKVVSSLVLFNAIHKQYHRRWEKLS